MLLLPTDIHNSKMMKIISLCAKKESPTYTSLSLSHQHLSQFYAKFFCKNFCRVLWWRKGGSPKVHCVYMFVRIWWFLGDQGVRSLCIFKVLTQFQFLESLTWNLSKITSLHGKYYFLLPSKFAQIIIYVKILRCETVVIKWKYMSIVNWVQKSSTSTLCVVAERRGSHHLIWWKNHTKLTIMIFFIFLYFLTIKGSWKKFFMQNIGITSRVLWSFGIGIFGLLFDDKKKKKINAEKHAFSCYLSPKIHLVFW